MRKIIGLIKTYFKDHFSFSYFLPVAVFTGLLIYINYKYDFEERFISYETNAPKQLLMYCLMYFTAFGGAYFLYIFNKKDRHLLVSPKLWGLILFSIFIFSFRFWFDGSAQLTKQFVPIPYHTVVNKYFHNLEGFIWLFIPCAIYWFIADRKNQPLYGFHSKGVVLKPYFVLLLLMVPLVAAASTQADFLATYPRAFHLGLEGGGIKNTLLTIFYELCYASDFITTEFFFRGFLILAFARIAGPRVILPMCVFYVTIHFEKPLGETISSFFGGWILGILAYETKSIYGGIIVHVGIAMLMEVVALTASQLF